MPGEKGSVFLALAILGSLALASLTLKLQRAIRWRRVRRRLTRGLRAQHQARAVLQRQGFRIVAEEHELPAVMQVDGEPLPYTVRIDYLVQRRGRTFGVEVKSGEQACDPLYRATRRQLLEYSHLLDADGLLLLDMEHGRLMEICFPGGSRARTWPWVLAVGFAAGLAAAALLGGGGP